MFFKDRKGSNLNRKRISIVSQTPNEIIADITRADNPTDEGTPINADTFNDFQKEIDTANNKSANAETNASSALAVASEAKTISNGAVDTANTAVETANEASTKADSAISTANLATNTANGAVTTANEALSNSEDAVTIASDASVKSDAAVATANSASTKSDAAVATATTASTNASSAVTTANEAKETATTALTNSEDAVTTSQEAKATALKVESALADRGATVNVAGVPQSIVSFTSDPQIQLNNKIDNTFDSIRESILSVAYPIGAIYLSVNPTDPETLFGGKWEAIQDRFLLSAGITYSAGTTGGEANHTLTANEMPTHKHDNTISVSGSQNSHNHSLWSGSGKTTNAAGLGYSWCYAVGGPDNDTSGRWYQGSTPKDGTAIVSSSTPTVNITSSISNANAGSGQAHNNMPPYLTVYMWKRIS